MLKLGCFFRVTLMSFANRGLSAPTSRGSGTSETTAAITSCFLSLPLSGSTALSGRLSPPCGVARRAEWPPGNCPLRQVPPPPAALVGGEKECGSAAAAPTHTCCARHAAAMVAELGDLAPSPPQKTTPPSQATAVSAACYRLPAAPPCW